MQRGIQNAPNVDDDLGPSSHPIHPGSKKNNPFWGLLYYLLNRNIS